MRFLIWFLLTPVLWAQTLNYRAVQPYAEGQIGAYDGLGYKNPILIGGVGADVDTARIYANLDLGAEWARKTVPGDGYAYHASGTVYAKLGRLLLGGGDVWSKEITSQWSKTAQRPVVGVGYDGENLRFIANYSLPFLDKLNGLQGLTGTLEVKATRRIHLFLSDGIYRYHDTGVGNANYHLGAKTFGGVKFAF